VVSYYVLKIKYVVSYHVLKIKYVLVTMCFFSSYPERDELKSIYGIYMSSILGLCLPKHETWKPSTKVANLTGSMIKIYEEVLANFLY
jgi:hypothetical protein